MVTFEKEKMFKFIHQDRLLHLVYNDLQSRGMDAVEAAEVVFNGYVLEDVEMESIYKNL